MVLQPNLVSGCAFILLSPYQTSRELDNAFVFYNNFPALIKRRKKQTKPIFKGSYLENTQYDLVEIWNMRWWHWLAFPLQKSFCFIKVSRSYVYMKISLLFFLLITHGCSLQASWAAQHTTMSWYCRLLNCDQLHIYYSIF